MTIYRSLQTIQAEQFTGTAVPDVTCGGSPEEVAANGCDSSRKQHLHVHTQATGGMTVLKPGDWIFPLIGGPWGVANDEKFRAHWEVPASVVTDPVLEEPALSPAPSPKTLDELLAEQNLPSVEEIKAVMADEAVGKVSTPDMPEGTVGVLTPAEELQKVIPEPGAGSMIVPDAPIDHVGA